MSDFTKKPEENFASLFAESQRNKTAATALKQDSVQVGNQLDVQVIKIGKDAVFVSLDGKSEGYIERADLGGSKEGPLSVKEGSRISAKVVEMGGKAGATRLVPLFVHPSVEDSQELEASPLAAALPGALFAAGMRVKGQVVRIERYGVFVQIAGTQDRRGRGLLPAEETGTPRGADLHKSFPPGKELDVKILSIDEQGRMRFSVRALALDEEQHAFTSFVDTKTQEKKSVTNSFGTFGDLLAKHTKKADRTPQR